jgi:hypothetical protein
VWTTTGAQAFPLPIQLKQTKQTTQGTYLSVARALVTRLHLNHPSEITWRNNYFLYLSYPLRLMSNSLKERRRNATALLGGVAGARTGHYFAFTLTASPAKRAFRVLPFWHRVMATHVVSCQ